MSKITPEIESYLKKKYPDGRIQTKDNLIWVYCGSDKPIIYDINTLKYLIKTNQL